MVDDKADIRLMLRHLLEPLDFAITLAEHGQEAVAKAQELHPDLILTDLMMPVMTGFEAVQILRQQPEFEHTPMMAISASVLSMDQEQSRRAGCDAFVSKPIDTQALLAVIGTLLPITWTYEDLSSDSEETTDADTTLTPPPHEDLEALYELSVLGRVLDISAYADRLEARDARYHVFARRLRELADAFEDEQLVDLQDYMEKKL